VWKITILRQKILFIPPLDPPLHSYVTFLSFVFRCITWFSATSIISTSWWWVSLERILVHVCIACADSVFSMPLACCSLISNDRASFSNCSRFISFSLSRVELQDWIIWDLISSSTLANSQFSASFRSFVWYLYVSILSPVSCFDCLNLYISYSWFLFGIK
jgi:hypothetical protein